MLIKTRVGILKEGRIILLLLIVVEFSYFASCLTNTSWLIRVIFVLPSLFIIPGAILLAILRHGINSITKLTVEGFFVSTIVSVMLTSIMLMLGLPLIPFNYSLAVLILVLSLSIIALIRKIEFKPSKPDTLLVTVAFLAYVALIIYFSGLPRLFTPDETSYIFSARMGILNGAVPPMGVRPDANEIKALFEGRYFWIYLLASFIGFTGLPAYQAGLLDVSFLIMTALASSLLVENKWLSTAVFVAVILNPLLLSFSALTLNDLAISFYAVFSVQFFVKAFSKNNNNISISIKKLLYSLLGITVLTMIKQNMMIFVTMWIILVCIILRYKLYKQDRNYKILLLIVALPVLIYELCLDMPYNVSYWILGNPEFARTVFGRFLFISPVEYFITMFFAPPWNPTANTLFTLSLSRYIDYFYRIFMPESSTLLVSAIILALPFLILSRNLIKRLDKTVLTLLVILSVWLFYFGTLSSTILSDVSRYSLWVIPLWIPLALTVLQDIINDTFPFRKLFPISIAMLILLWTNIWLSKEKGGVYIGYGLPSRLWTADIIMFQLISLLVILNLLFLKKGFLRVRLTISKNLSVLKTLNFRVIVFSLIIIFILLNEVHFGLQFMQSSILYEDHGLITLNKALENFSNNENWVFANNYIYMRPYVNDKILRQGLLLPSPDTREGFLKLLGMLPNGTLFLISMDDATNWHVAGNEYIKSYADLNIIFPQVDTSKWSRFDLPESILKITFDDGNKTTIMDYSGFGNNGINYGANIVDGRYGYAASFDGVNDYIRIPNSPSLHSDVITISAWIKTNVSQNSWIVSKYESRNKGEYLLGVSGNNLRFSVVINGSTTDYLAPFNYYDGKWHHIVCVYDGSYMRIYVDGVQRPNPLAQTGNIDDTTYDVVIGSGHGASGYFFNGFIDEVQVSSRPLDITEFLKSCYEYYATKVYETSLIDGKAKVKLFCNINKEIVRRSEIRVKDSNIFIDKNRTVIVNLKIESDITKEIAIILATDRFTKVYSENLNTGINDVTLEYPFNLDPLWYSYYWSRLGGINRLIVLNDNKIIYNSFLSIMDLKRLNFILHIFTIILITGIMLINLKQLSIGEK